jgi:carotenoid cleavage dioxygenase-like enzyme
LQAFARLDTVSKELQYWDAGPRGFCGELVFVPGEEEDQECSGSFLLGMVFYADLQRSALVVRQYALTAFHATFVVKLHCFVGFGVLMV